MVSPSNLLKEDPCKQVKSKHTNMLELSFYCPTSKVLLGLFIFVNDQIIGLLLHVIFISVRVTFGQRDVTKAAQGESQMRGHFKVNLYEPNVKWCVAPRSTNKGTGKGNRIKQATCLEISEFMSISSLQSPLWVLSGVDSESFVSHIEKEERDGIIKVL